MKVDVFQALANPRRRQVMKLVVNQPCSAGVIAAAMPSLSLGAVSQHLRILREAGLVEATLSGRNRIYSLPSEGLPDLGQEFERILQRTPKRSTTTKGKRGPKPQPKSKAK